MIGRKIARIAQILFGLGLFIFGLNNFMKFLPLPGKENFAEIFLETLHQAKYLFPTIAIIQIFTGITLISNRWVTLGLLVLLPISFNIFSFHLLHDRQSLMPAVVILGVNVLLLWLRREFIKPIFNKRG